MKLATTPALDFAALKEVEATHDVNYMAGKLARRRAHYAGSLHTPALEAVERALYGGGAEIMDSSPAPEGGKVLPLWKGGAAA